MKNTNQITVAVVQQSCSDNKQDNLEKTATAIKSCKQQGAQLILLQELHATRYFCQNEDFSQFSLAETIPGETTNFLSCLSKEHQVIIVGSLFEKRAEGIFHNTAVVFDNDGSLAGTYRKMHIPDDPGYYEKFYFTGGDAMHHNINGFQPIKTSIGNLGVLVCWDQWFPEAARLMALSGANLLLYPTAIGWDPSDDKTLKTNQQTAWQITQRAHAIANHLPVIVTNRVGFEADPSGVTAGIDFWGSSFITGPQGEILAQASIDETILTATIDLASTGKLRQTWPFLRDRRIDAYQGLLNRYND